MKFFYGMIAMLCAIVVANTAEAQRAAAENAQSECVADRILYYGVRGLYYSLEADTIMDKADAYTYGDINYPGQPRPQGATDALIAGDALLAAGIPKKLGWSQRTNAFYVHAVGSNPMYNQFPGFPATLVYAPYTPGWMTEAQWYNQMPTGYDCIDGQADDFEEEGDGHMPPENWSDAQKAYENASMGFEACTTPHNEGIAKFYGAQDEYDLARWHWDEAYGIGGGGGTGGGGPPPPPMQ